MAFRRGLPARKAMAFYGGFMLTDAEKVLALVNYMFQEGIRVEDSLKVMLYRRFAWHKDFDQLDMLDVIRAMDRREYFNELSAIVNAILFDSFKGDVV